MRRLFKLAVPCAAAAAAFAVLAPVASANNGLGPLPPTPPFSGTDYIFEDEVPPSDGITPQQGLVFAGFLKGDESYLGNGTTTIVDFSLPQGVTIVNDPTNCGNLGFNGLCILEGGTCDPPTSVTANGSEVEFQIACEPGEFFEWEALVSSLLPTGSYDVNIQYKVYSYKRAKPGPNMWQVKLPGAFVVS